MIASHKHGGSENNHVDVMLMDNRMIFFELNFRFSFPPCILDFKHNMQNYLQPFYINEKINRK